MLHDLELIRQKSYGRNLMLNDIIIILKIQCKGEPFIDIGFQFHRTFG